MATNSRFSKGGSSAFLKTLKTQRSSRGSLDRAIPILADLQSGDTKTEELQKKYPLAEKVVAGLVADGLTNRQIGATLHLAEKTVKNYVSSILHKLGFSRRTEAAVYAVERRHGH